MGCKVFLEMNRVASRSVGPTAERCIIANNMGFAGYHLNLVTHLMYGVQPLQPSQLLQMLQLVQKFQLIQLVQLSQLIQLVHCIDANRMVSHIDT